MGKRNSDDMTCFIITPIGGNGTLIRRKIDGIIDEVLEPVLKECGFSILVSHRINDTGSVTNAIIRGVYESDLVIANLTGSNPNVMYEVALRHASAKPIIHITENIEELPFDINDQRTIAFVDDMAGALQLKEDLKSVIKGIDFDTIASNPVTEALEMKNLVNVPTQTAMEFPEMLLMMQEEIKQINKQLRIMRGEGISKKAPIVLECNDLSGNQKEFEMRVMKYYEELGKNFLSKKGML